MRHRRATNHFFETMVSAIGPVIARASASERLDVGSRLVENLLGQPLRPVPAASGTREEVYAYRLFKGFIEIHACAERLADCETYLARFPFARTRVKRHAYLQFIVESHLHEIYILRERLTVYVKHVARAYRRAPDGPRIAKLTDRLITLVTDALSEMTVVRGGHVHQTRYSNAVA